MFDLNDVLVLDREWIIRNDDHYLLLYKIEPSEAKTWVLPPVLSYAVALINGQNTYEQLISYIGYILSIDNFEESKKATDNILHQLETNGVTVEIKSSEDKWNIFDSSRFFIPIQHYRFPKHSRLRLPTKINLFITKKCHAECIYCYADRRKDNPRDLLSAVEWRNIIDECLSLGIWGIEIVGGDPLSCKESRDLVGYLISKSVPVFLSTKCEITESIAKDLISHGFLRLPRGPPHKLQLSIDSVEPKIADMMTGTKGFVQRISRSVENCIKHGIYPKIKSVLTAINFNEIENIIMFFSTKGVREFQFVYYGLSYFKPRPDLLLSPEQKQWIHDCYTKRIIPRYQSSLSITIQNEYHPKPLSFMEKMSSWHKRAKCTGGYSCMTILPTGKVILCEQLPQTEEFIVSDIRKDGLAGAWQEEAIEKFLFPPRKAFSGTVCEVCQDFEECHYNAGFCYRDALFAYDTIFEASPNCPYQVKQGKRLL